MIDENIIINIMNEVDVQRQKSNETATFNKIQKQPFKSDELSSIAQENDITNLQSSLSLPKPLIKNDINDFQHEFTHGTSNQIQSKVVVNAPHSNNNITFYPRFANRLLYQQTDLSTLKQEQNKLKGQLSGLNQMITDLVNKKSDLLNEYQEIIKEKKCYKRLKKNLQQEYQGYLFMLEGDYCQKLDEQTQKQRQIMNKLKREVHALNHQLSKPLGTVGYREVQQNESQQKEYFQLQINEQKLKINNKRKQERLAVLRQKNAEKESEIKQIIKKIDKLQYERQIQDIYPQEAKANQQQYDELANKVKKLKKINDTNIKIKQMQFYRKLKENKEKDLTNHNLTRQIQQANERLYKLLIQVDRAKPSNSKFSTFQQQIKKVKTESANNKKKTPIKQQLKHFVSQKNKLSIQYETDKKETKSLAKVQTQAFQFLDDRPELLMRRKKIYTQLQKNLYFKNIENSEQQKISRVYETQVKGKDKIAISSYDRFNNENIGKQLKLPQIEHYRLKTEGNESIIYQIDKRINKKSIDMHNRHIKQLRTNKHRLHSQSNYRQLCSILNRDRLLIQQDCEYDVSQLIYTGQS